MGSNASTGGGGGGVGPAGITKKGTYGTVQEAKKVSSRNELTTAIKEFEPLPVKIIKAVVEGQKKSKQNVLDYEGQAAGVTPMRSPMIIERGGDGGNNGGAIATSGQVVQAPTVTAPTTAEVSQSAATDAVEDNILLRKRKAKARGRSLTIQTGPTGLQTNGSLTLGRPSLLGRA